MTTNDDETRVRELLAPLATVEPVIRRTKQRRPLTLVAAVALAALAAGGIALAAGLGPFAGIRAADRPRAAEDALSPAALAAITSANATRKGLAAGQLLPDSARLVTRLSSGDRVYAVATTTDGLCVLIQGLRGGSADSDRIAFACGNPLSQEQPTTQETIQADPETPPLTFGVAKDDVVGISFVANGSERTVLVEDNVWAYQGAVEPVPPLTIHYADGSTQQLENH